MHQHHASRQSIRSAHGRAIQRLNTVWEHLTALTLVLLVSTACMAGTSRPETHWVGTWACAPVGELPIGADAIEGGPQQRSVTIRDVVSVSLGGEVLRLRLSNEFGATALAIDDVHVALSLGQDKTQPGTDHAVTFSGVGHYTIPAGKAVLSDPIVMHVAPLSSLAVSLYVPEQKNATLTYHVRALATNFYAVGDQTSATTLDHPRAIHSWIFLTGIDVEAPPKAAAIVTYGDSITDGLRSTVDGNRRWPDDLARRLQANKATADLSVLNLAISGNRVLYPQSGPGLVERLDRDVFGQSGVKYLILFAGINDIGHSINRPDPAQKESAQDIMAGMESIVEQAHAHGIKVFVATITPCAGGVQCKPAGQTMRHEINAWIRNGKGFDGVLDFDAALRSAGDPDALASAYDTPDHVHTNDAGYQAIADSIPLALFQ